MAKLTWHNTGDNQWETGVDQVFISNKLGGTALAAGEYKVAWNGVTSISNSPEGAEPTDIYADNIKYLTLMSAENFKASIECYNYPTQFKDCIGENNPAPGLFISAQEHKGFHLCYRTKIGDETTNDKGYKYHFIYNCKVGVSESQYQTINDSPEAITFSYNISTTPYTFASDVARAWVEKLKPTAYICVDTTKLDASKVNQFNTWFNTAVGLNDAVGMPTPNEIIAVIA